MAVDRDRIEALVRESLKTLGDRRGETYTMPRIAWDLRGKSCLGQAVGTDTIRLHPEAAAKLGDAYDGTVIHESCHIAQMQEARRYATSLSGKWSAHGPVWKSMMRTLGQTPTRCARLPEGVTLTPVRTVERFIVKCGCKEHTITKVRLNKGLDRYRCARCGSGLTLVGRAA